MDLLMPIVKYPISLFLLLCCQYVLAGGGDYGNKVKHILNMRNAPEGVVFEIINRDPLFLNWALPEVERISLSLRQKFPKLDIVVVSHGNEMFSLTAQSQSSNPDVKNMVNQLLSGDIPVYVCGTYAERRGLVDSDFPGNVKVAAEGPAQINDYIKLGYYHIKLDGR